MPANALPLAVFVGCENEFFGFLEGGFQFRDEFLFLAGDDVQRSKIGGDIHPWDGPFLLFDFLGISEAFSGRSRT